MFLESCFVDSYKSLSLCKPGNQRILEYQSTLLLCDAQGLLQNKTANCTSPCSQTQVQHKIVLSLTLTEEVGSISEGMAHW